MEVVAGEREFGPMGPAKVSLVGKVVQVVFKESGEIANLSLDALPEGVKKIASGEYLVSLSKDRTKMYILHPLNATVEVEFIGFKKSPGQPPFPRPPAKAEGINRKTGMTYPKKWLEFTAYHRVVGEQHKGLTIQMKLRYYFGVGSDGTHAAVKGEGDWSQKLSRWLDCATGDISKIKVVFSDNILPPLETLLLRESRPFQMILENGWVSTTAATIGKRKSPAKKSAKKPAKKKK